MKRLARSSLKRLATVFTVGMLLGIFSAVAVAALVVRTSARGHSYASTAEIPERQVALVLGCSPLLQNGNPSPFFVARMDAAAELYHAGKVEFLLVSGARARGYDETASMATALMERGVPQDRIAEDGRGLRTLDSVMRAASVYGLKDFTIVSQRFHNQRAIFIAQCKDLEVVAYDARPATGGLALRAQIRESLARIRALLDVYVLDTQPRLSGRADDHDALPSEKDHS